MDNDALHKPIPAPQPGTPSLLQDLSWLLTSALERIASCERRCGSGWIDMVETSTRLHRLAQAVAVTGTDHGTRRIDERLDQLEHDFAQLAACTPRPEQQQVPSKPVIEVAAEITAQAPRKPVSTQAATDARRQGAAATRERIAAILAKSPHLSCAKVLAILERSSGDRPVPALRTVAVHVKALRAAKLPHSNGHMPA